MEMFAGYGKIPYLCTRNSEMIIQARMMFDT